MNTHDSMQGEGSMSPDEPGHLLRLHAEMKVPGRAWLQFEVTPGPDTTLLVQLALFTPKGVWGVLYWYGLYPVHGLLFASLVAVVARQRTIPPPKEETLVRGRDTRPDRDFERSATLREVQHRHGDPEHV
jgi:Protein of unknown function (DUF2867)